MTEPVLGEVLYWKVRLMFEGQTLWAASRTAPLARRTAEGLIVVDADWIENTDHGDTFGPIDWTRLWGVSWRPEVAKPARAPRRPRKADEPEQEGA